MTLHDTKRPRLRDWLRWQRGRRDGGYAKLLIMACAWPVKCDCYLLHFPKGARVAPHVDSAVGAHYRLNVILVPAHRGGVFRSACALIGRPRIKLFRPDICLHEVTEVLEGSRWVLSIGWLRAKECAGDSEADSD